MEGVRSGGEGGKWRSKEGGGCGRVCGRYCSGGVGGWLAGRAAGRLEGGGGRTRGSHSQSGLSTRAANTLLGSR